jgi:hypothetical protein
MPELNKQLTQLKEGSLQHAKYRIYAFCDPGGSLYLTYNVFENMHGMSTLHMVLRKL